MVKGFRYLCFKTEYQIVEEIKTMKIVTISKTFYLTAKGILSINLWSFPSNIDIHQHLKFKEVALDQEIQIRNKEKMLPGRCYVTNISTEAMVVLALWWWRCGGGVVVVAAL